MTFQAFVPIEVLEQSETMIDNATNIMYTTNGVHLYQGSLEGSIIDGGNVLSGTGFVITTVSVVSITI